MQLINLEVKPVISYDNPVFFEPPWAQKIDPSETKHVKTDTLSRLRQRKESF